VQLWVIAALVVAFVGVVLKGTRGEPHPIVLVLLALAIGFFGWREYTGRQLEDRLGKVASTLAMRPVGVKCQGTAAALVDAGAELGTVQFDQDGEPAGHTDLTHGVCDHLESYLGGHQALPSGDEVIAVHVLAHESYHLFGIIDEGRTECMSVQNTARTAELLGATPTEARSLAQRYWNEFYPRLPDEYRSSECHDGGGLDRHPASSDWP
jgi:hypothetical protein